MADNETITLGTPATGDEILYLEVLSDAVCNITQVMINGSTTRLYLDFGRFDSACGWEGRIYRLQPGDQTIVVTIDNPSSTWFTAGHVISGDAMVPDNYTVADNSGLAGDPISTLGGWTIVTSGIVVATAMIATSDTAGVTDIPGGWVLETDLDVGISVAHAYLVTSAGTMTPQFWGTDAAAAWQVTTVPFYDVSTAFREAGGWAATSISQPSAAAPEQSVDFAGQSINVIPPPDPTEIVVPTPPYTHTPTRRVN